MTEAGSIIGTAQYLSPEQARGAPVDQRSDLYSVGDRALRDAHRAGAVHRRHAGRDRDEAPLRGAASRRRSCGRRCRTTSTSVVLRALAKDPEDRYQTAEEMDADLERVARGPAGRPRRPSRRRDRGALRLGRDGSRADLDDPARADRRATGAAGRGRRRRLLRLRGPARRRWPDLAVGAVDRCCCVAAARRPGSRTAKIQDQLSVEQAVAVPFVVRIRRAARGREDSRTPAARRKSSARPATRSRSGTVIGQSPGRGRVAVAKNTATSTSTSRQGKPRSQVPERRRAVPRRRRSRAASPTAEASIRTVPVSSPSSPRTR